MLKGFIIRIKVNSVYSWYCMYGAFFNYFFIWLKLSMLNYLLTFSIWIFQRKVFLRTTGSAYLQWSHSGPDSQWGKCCRWLAKIDWQNKGFRVSIFDIFVIFDKYAKKVRRFILRTAVYQPDSLRGCFGLTDTRNACHGSGI